MDEQLIIYVDTLIYNQAKKIIEDLGLDLETAINIFLGRVIETKSIPFDYSYMKSKFEMEDYILDFNFKEAVKKALDEAKEKGLPIARFDSKKECSYIEYPDGHRVYHTRKD